MKKLILIIAVVIGLSSCQKETYVYNHNFKVNKSQINWYTQNYVIDHILTKEEEKNWCIAFDNKMKERGYQIDTSYVSFVSDLKKYKN